MASKPMSQWDEDELFGQGYLTKRTAATADKLLGSVPLLSAEEKREGAGDMDWTRLVRPMHAHSAPPGWVCNAKKRHYPEGVESRDLIKKVPNIQPCNCTACIRRTYPYLEEGKPWVPNEHPEMADVLHADFVGLYETGPLIKLEVPCSVCGGPVKLDGRTAEKFDKDQEEATHVACLSDANAQALHTLVGGTFALPHIIRKRNPEKQEDKCDGQEDENEGGGPAG